MRALRHVIDYLKCSPDVRRNFSLTEPEQTSELVAFTDGAVGRDKLTGKVSSGNVAFYQTSQISGNSSNQNRVSTSAAEADANEIYCSAKKLISLLELSLDLRKQPEHRIRCVVLTDSMNFIQTNNNPRS